MVYLKGLNGLRALAAFAVMYTHTGMAIGRLGLPSIPGSGLAGFGVTVFFALSGFLITYLLMQETDETGDLSVRRFYMRRILRIWPLYFFYLAANAGFLLAFEGGAQLQNLLPYLVFVPNVSFVLGSEVPNAGHYWSLGVEEQFYLLWPWFMLFFRHRPAKAMATFVVAFFVLKVWTNLQFGGYSTEYTMLYVTRVDCMAIGGLGAWLLRRRAALAARWSQGGLQALAWTVLALTAVNRFHILSILDHEAVAVATVVLIWSQVLQDRRTPLVNLERRGLDFLGTLSFGLYVYHPGVIYVLEHLLPLPGGAPGIVVLFVSVFTTTIVVAHLSYRLLEAPFLRLKHRFAVIHSAASQSEAQAPAG